jgi:putative ABC transport system substrate-binding protein
MYLDRLNRREAITLLAGVAAAWQQGAWAQQPAMPVVGFLSAGSAARGPSPRHAAAFRQGLQETGFVESRNVAIEYRWAEDQYDRLPPLAADLIQHRVAVIAAGPRADAAAKAVTASIPIVFMSGGDPIRSGFVTSLSRPGGNLTGVSILASDLTRKRFGLFRDLVPQAAVIGLLADSTNPRGEFQLQEAQAAASNLAVPVRLMRAGSEGEIEAAFTELAQEGVTALFVVNGFLFYSLSDRLTALAARHRIALSGELRVFVEFGGLMYYGPNELEAFRQVGRYTGRILKGEKPGDLPVMLPTKIDFVVNLQNAKALGLEIPAAIISAADEIIE